MTNRMITALLSALGMVVSVAAFADDLTIERLHANSSLNGDPVRGAQISPDGTLITFLKGREDDARRLDLWAYDRETGTASMLVSSTDLVGEEVALSEEEKNRRERQRIYSNGIIGYQWDAQGRRILFPLGGDVFVYDLNAKAATRVTQTDAFETDPKFSPGGNFVSYVRDDELFVTELDSGRERQVTKGAGGTIRNGVAEFVAQEELDRDTGYWWAPGETRIAFTRIDENPVPIAERVDINADDIVTIRQRYPFAGADNVAIRLGVTSPKQAKPTWIDLGPEPDVYLADVYWSVKGETLYVARLTRDQKRLDLLKADPKTGASEVLLSETADTWVNLGLGLTPLEDGGFLWSSERGGYQQLYRYGPDGDDRGVVTAGATMVSDLDCLDTENGRLFFTGWRDTALERHVYTKSLAGRDLARPLTGKQGWNSANFSGNCETFILTHSNINQPPQASVHDASGERLFWLSENRLDDNHPYAPYLDSHLEWEFGTLEAEDGQTLDYRLLKPAGLAPGEGAPAINLIYGGPHAQRVSNSWGGLFAQLLADKGYVVFQLDNRGADNRGTAFENPLYRAMAGVEVTDQAAGTQWLAGQDYVDPEHIGVYGWSYGGYMTLHMLMQKPGLFAAGISGAPVTDWSFYDTAYTERYMGDPETDAEAYAKSSALTYADNLEDPLLIIHGMADDNVIFQNTVKLVDTLQKAGKPFELMTYPGEKHGFRAKTSRLHRDQLIVDFFERHLK